MSAINDTVKAVEGHLTSIMNILEVEETESNKNTPNRIARMWYNEFCKNMHVSPEIWAEKHMTLFPANKASEQQSIAVRDIEFTSYCEHHFLPFSGTVDLVYVPNEHVIGLSKVPRMVDFVSKKPQLQENLTSEVMDMFVDRVKPMAVLIKVHATHQCVACRGAENNCSTSTELLYVARWVSIPSEVEVRETLRNCLR